MTIREEWEKSRATSGCKTEVEFALFDAGKPMFYCGFAAGFLLANKAGLADQLALAREFDQYTNSL